MPNKQYFIIESENCAALERDISEHLNDGWQLAGGVAVSSYTTRDRDDNDIVTTTFYQAIVKL